MQSRLLIPAVTAFKHPVTAACSRLHTHVRSSLCTPVVGALLLSGCLHAAAKRRKHGAAEVDSDEEELSEDRGFARPPVPPRPLQGQPSTSGPAAGEITSLTAKISAGCRAPPS